MKDGIEIGREDLQSPSDSDKGVAAVSCDYLSSVTSCRRISFQA